MKRNLNVGDLVTYDMDKNVPCIVPYRGLGLIVEATEDEYDNDYCEYLVQWFGSYKSGDELLVQFGFFKSVIVDPSFPKKEWCLARQLIRVTKV